MKIHFLISIAAFISCNAFSQSYDNNWIFGDGAGLNFSTDLPNHLYSSITANEASASISDNFGNLLFYTNGLSIWNKVNEIMPNGDSIHIGKVGLVSIDNDTYGSSITQGVIIIPSPEAENLYYIFQLQGGAFIGAQYSIIDMNLNGGFGDVTDKNLILTTDTLQEKMTAVKHANGRDWWLVVRKMINHETDVVFSKYLITPSGIEGPYDQNYGPDYDAWADNDIGVGQMIFSLQGDKIINTRGYHLDIYNFDRCSGEFSNHQAIKDIAHNFGALYGCSFSADASKIYVAEECIGKNLYQYCLDCDEVIDSTKKLIYDGPDGSYCDMQHMLGPNGKIYIAIAFSEHPSDIYNFKNQNLSVINYPNELFPTCDFDSNTVSIGEGRVINGLPNMPNYNLGALAGSPCDTIGVSINTPVNKTEIIITPNPAQEYFYLTGIEASNLIALELFDMAGNRIKNFTHLTTTTFYVNDINAGIYLCKIKTKNGADIFEKLEIIK